MPVCSPSPTRLGSYSPIDVGDGSGMNLLDIRTKQWWGPALAAVAGAPTNSDGVPGLLSRLGPRCAESFAVVGPVSKCDAPPPHTLMPCPCTHANVHSDTHPHL